MAGRLPVRHEMKLENSMIAEFLTRQEPKTSRRTRIASLFLYLASATAVSGAGSGAIASEQAGTFATICALKETKVITLIEDHGDAQDLPSDSLSDAGLAMLHARSACYDGRVGEALALYDAILNLGPVVSLRKP